MKLVKIIIIIFIVFILSSCDTTEKGNPYYIFIYTDNNDVDGRYDLLVLKDDFDVNTINTDINDEFKNKYPNYNDMEHLGLDKEYISYCAYIYYANCDLLTWTSAIPFGTSVFMNQIKFVYFNVNGITLFTSEEYTLKSYNFARFSREVYFDFDEGSKDVSFYQNIYLDDNIKYFFGIGFVIIPILSLFNVLFAKRIIKKNEFKWGFYLTYLGVNAILFLTILFVGTITNMFILNHLIYMVFHTGIVLTLIYFIYRKETSFKEILIMILYSQTITVFYTILFYVSAIGYDM